MFYQKDGLEQAGHPCSKPRRMPLGSGNFDDLYISSHCETTLGFIAVLYSPAMFVERLRHFFSRSRI